MPEPESEFERQARKPGSGLLPELVGFFRHSGKWWLAPVFLALLVIGALMVLGQSAVAPFIYTLF